MERVDRWGHCSNCGDPSFHELCNKCDGKEPKPEDVTLYLCPECKSKYSDIKGQPCEGCQEEAHKDGKHFDHCCKCDEIRPEVDCESCD